MDLKEGTRVTLAHVPGVVAEIVQKGDVLSNAGVNEDEDIQVWVVRYVEWENEAYKNIYEGEAEVGEPNIQPIE